MRSPLDFSDDENRILNTPFKDLSASERLLAFSLSDEISDWNRAQPSNSSSGIVIQDKDKLLANGVVSPLDGKTAFHNRRAWGEHLKANDCVEIGNDYNNSHKKKREIEGDFDCRKELAQAINQVAEKHGY